MARGGSPPRSGVVEANDTLFFVERRGHGTPMLVIHGAGQNAGLLRGLADALAVAGFQVLVHDRRGTGHSGRDAWPGSGAAQHADDAAALLRVFSCSPAVVVGVGSGGIIALKLIELHPDCVSHAIVWEPPAAGAVPGGAEATARMLLPITAHLADHPHDYLGAQAILLSAMCGSSVTIDDPDFARQRVNAEAMVRDEPTISLTTFGAGLRGRPVTLAHGAAPGELVLAAVAELGRLTGRPVHHVTSTPTAYLTDPSVLVRLVMEVAPPHLHPACGPGTCAGC